MNTMRILIGKQLRGEFIGRRDVPLSGIVAPKEEFNCKAISKSCKNVIKNVRLLLEQKIVTLCLCCNWLFAMA